MLSCLFFQGDCIPAHFFAVIDPHLCGVKQFPIENGRYLVFLFEASEYEGELVSSEEGAMYWVPVEQLKRVNLVSDFEDNLSEFQYVIEGEEWRVVKR